MRSFLDSEALFVDEDGMIAERGNVLRVETAISPKGSAITITDWVVHHAEDLAVTSFVCDQAVPYGERALTLKSLAVEAWIKRDAGWKLMASYSIPLHADPAPADLPTDALNDYVGSYNAPGGLSVVISREGSGITNKARARTLLNVPARAAVEHPAIPLTGLPP
jgi:hypothetical protein